MESSESTRLMFHYELLQEKLKPHKNCNLFGIQSRWSSRDDMHQFHVCGLVLCAGLLPLLWLQWMRLLSSFLSHGKRIGRIIINAKGDLYKMKFSHFNHNQIINIFINVRVILLDSGILWGWYHILLCFSLPVCFAFTTLFYTSTSAVSQSLLH